ncbi:MAG: monooxygenase [Phenylobacterium sp.]|uniref:FAD-dependent monooxygenase n=1 Tax=Phenylobacterium sp. TaxID=1871053 RepID=UPI0025DED272|nr:FAD-dependent monooxygenase [Phenylobacterium sp.]MBA4013739.1 monooxygenase [Phenylobacterium sp.]
MQPKYSTAIAIAGAGPVGMTLAIDAALRGVDVILIEARAAGEPPSAKCNTVAARTMETFRRLGVSEAVRAAGLPDDYPTDTIYCTSITGHELTRIRMPARSERTHPGFHDSHWPTPESMVRVSQLYLEPILYDRVKSLPNITVLNRTSVEAYDQDETGVTLHCKGEGGEAFDIRATYLAGCDGGRSTIRKAMGVSLVGDAEISRTRSSLIRAPGLKALFGDRRPAWMSWVQNPKRSGTVVAIDGEDVWLVHRGVASSEAFEDVPLEESIRDVLGVDADFSWEVLNHEDWIGRRMVAERFRDGRVFIAGDAAHLWVPFAGYGMNAGVADAAHLSWLLCAVVKGWADPAILEAYQAERQPITEQVSHFAMKKVMENIEAMRSGGSIPPALVADTPEGQAIRQFIGQRLFDINVPQMSPEGLNFGYYYEGSPIIAYDGEAPPAYDMGSFTPSTAPGCRLPHFRLDDGTSIYDRLGSDYTLISFGADETALLQAASAAGLPLTLIPATRPTDEVFRHQLLLVRFDEHIVWRGDEPPADAAALASQLQGQAE